MTAAPRPGLLLIAHGSRDQRHAHAIAALARAVRRDLAGVAVEVGFLGLCEPSVSRAYGRLVEAGAGSDATAGDGGPGPGSGARLRAVRVVPLFLRAGYHVRHDVPQAMAEARHTFPSDVEVTVAGALGPDRLLAAAFDRRIREAGGRPDDPELDLIPAGATRKTEVDAAALAAPLPPGRRRRLVLAGFLAPGELPDRARARAREAGVPITEPLISEASGPAGELVRLVAARYCGDLGRADLTAMAGFSAASAAARGPRAQGSLQASGTR